MHARTRNALLSLGFDTNLIAKIAGHNHAVEALRSLSKPALHQDYTPEEVELIQDRIKRQPIPEDTLERVIEKAGEVCCFCADGNSAPPLPDPPRRRVRTHARQLRGQPHPDLPDTSSEYPKATAR